jgi:hypothetical protein
MVSRSCGVAFVFTIWISFDEDAKDDPSNQPHRQSSGASDNISNEKSFKSASIQECGRRPGSQLSVNSVK